MRLQQDRSGYLSHDTIAAIATELGGAISIVRVSGKMAFTTLVQITHSEETQNSRPREMRRCRLYHSADEPLDDALYVRFVSPESYTGEDLVEYHLHGSGFIAHQLLNTLSELGVRQALPGEFSFRAVRNAKMSLFQAQAVADLIHASDGNAVSLALDKMSGSQNGFLHDLGDNLRRIAVLGEVGIDFADQDIEEISLPVLKKKLLNFIEILRNLQNTYSRGTRIQDGIRVAFVGLPNVGKSSFFNALLGENRSLVSEVEGTTRDTVSEKLTLRGKKKTITLRLEDTAGLRNTENLVEKMGIERTYQTIGNADLVLFLVDPSTTLETAQEKWSELLSESQEPIEERTIGIFTKSDLLPSSTDALSFSSKFSKISNWICTSAKSGAGVQEVADAIIEFGEKWTRRKPGEVLLTRLDHHSAVTQALDHLQRAQGAPEIDLFASDIRQTLHSLAPLIGETVPDDILGKIFSDFCIGK